MSVREKRKGTKTAHRPAQPVGGRRVLRLPAVIERTGKSRTGIYGGVAAGTFPAPVPIGVRAVGWIEEELDAWLEAQIATRDEKRGAAA